MLAKVRRNECLQHYAALDKWCAYDLFVSQVRLLGSPLHCVKCQAYSNWSGCFLLEKWSLDSQASHSSLAVRSIVYDKGALF